MFLQSGIVPPSTTTNTMQYTFTLLGAMILAAVFFTLNARGQAPGSVRQLAENYHSALALESAALRNK